MTYGHNIEPEEMKMFNRGHQLSGLCQPPCTLQSFNTKNWRHKLTRTSDKHDGTPILLRSEQRFSPFRAKVLLRWRHTEQIASSSSAADLWGMKHDERTALGTVKEKLVEPPVPSFTFAWWLYCRYGHMWPAGRLCLDSEATGRNWRTDSILISFVARRCARITLNAEHSKISKCWSSSLKGKI